MTEQPLIYLDNAATTFPKPEPVYQAMDSFYRQFGGNAGRGSNPLARKAAALVEETRHLLTQWLDAPEVIFTPSATIALNTVILGAGLRAGDVVYVSPFEHNSVLRPLEHLRQRVGIQVKVLPFDRDTFACKLDEVAALFKLEPPSMVCISLVSNVLGLILPVDEITRLAKASNNRAITIIDGAQAAGLLEIDMAHIDALIFSGHKSLYGPYGIAGIGFGTDWRPAPLFLGGTGTQSESIEMPLTGSSRYEAGSQNIQAVAGLNAALHWLNEIGRDEITTHTTNLTAYAYEVLSDLPQVLTYVPSDKRCHFGILSFSIEGTSPQAVESFLGANNIAVRAGLHCSPWTHRFIKSILAGGLIRLSLSEFNLKTDVDKLLNGLENLI